VNRLQFLRVSVLGAVAAFIGLDRERLARRWLERNGFIIEQFDNIVSIFHGPRYVGIDGAFAHSIGSMQSHPFQAFMVVLKRNNFEIRYRDGRLKTRFQRPWLLS
jgi:hypothetical protein